MPLRTEPVLWAAGAGPAVTGMASAVAGAGGASKDQMERMVQTLLGIAQPLRPVDAADAVALALCHLAHAPMRARVARAVAP